MPPNQPNQYDFILNPNQKPRRSFNFGNSQGARIAIIVGGLLFIIMLFMLAMSFLNGDKNTQKQRLIEVAQAQNEIVRVASLTEKKAKNIDTVNFAVNTKMSVASSQVEIKKTLASYGVKDKALSKPLAASKNPKNDEALVEATQNNRFDETFLAIMNKQLDDYQQLLKNAHAGAQTKSEKQTLQAAYDNVGRLETATTAVNR